MVTVGGTDTEREPDAEPRTRGLVLVVVGLATGLILGALFDGPRGELDATPGSFVEEPSAAPPPSLPTTTTTEVVVRRLATMVPGMLDTLVASTVDRTGADVVTAWTPAAPAPVGLDIPWGAFVVDSSRTWLAHGASSRWVAQNTLWVGNRSYMEPVTTSLAGGPVWHTRFPGSLIWVESSPAGPMLMTAQFVAGQTAFPRPVTALNDGVEPVWWNDGGVTTMRVDGMTADLTLLDDAGEAVTTITVTAVGGAGAALMAVIDDSGDPVLLDHTLTVIAAAPWSADCNEIGWGPTGLSAIALCGADTDYQFEYWQDVLTDTAPRSVLSGSNLTVMGFTSEGFPFATDVDPLRPTTAITFFRPFDGQSYVIDHPGRIFWLGTMR